MERIPKVDTSIEICFVLKLLLSNERDFQTVHLLYQALKGSPDSLMWFCEHCLTAFPGVKKVMIQIGSLEDKYEKLDERVTSLETQPKEIENISEIVREEVKELQDIESRKLHMVCFNLPESESSDPDERKSDDTNSLKSLIHEDMKLYDKNIEIENPVRLGKKIEKTQSVAGSNTNKTGDRPLRFKVGKFEDKRVILQANSELKNSSNENVKKIFITPDQTRRQREESFKLREELRYRKRVKNEKNLKISRGRIVSVEQSKEFLYLEFVLHHIKGSMSGTATPFNKSSTIINYHLIMYPG